MCLRKTREKKVRILEKTKKHSRKIKRKIFTALGILALFAGLAFFLLSGGNIEIFEDIFTNGASQEELREALSSLGVRGYVTAAVLSMLQVIFTFIPAEPAQVLTGLSFGLWEGVGLCMIGVFVGNTILYILYKIYGQKLTEVFEKTAEFDFSVARKSTSIAFIIAIMYFLPAIPYGFICLFTASLNTRYPRYIFLTTVFAFPSVLIGVALGNMAIEASWVISLVVFAVLVIVLLLVLRYRSYIFRKINEYIKKREVRLQKKGTNRLLLYPLVFGSRIVFDTRLKVKLKKEVKRIKGPAIVLSNHGSFIDFVYVMRFLKKERPNIIANRLYFYHGILGKLMKKLGCLPKSMFSVDMENVKECVRVLNVKEGVLTMMPEARLSTVGKFEGIQDSTYNFIKKLKCPVYVMKFDGAYLANPKWGDKIRRGSYIEGNLSLLMTKEEVATLSLPELKEKIEEGMHYDEFAWLEQHPELTYKSKTLAEGLENVLYRCPECGALYSMKTEKRKLWCEKCGMTTEIDSRYGFVDNKPFKNFSEWYEWQNKVTKEEILQNPDFSLFSEVELCHACKNGKRLIREAGKGECVLNAEGLRYTGTEDGQVIEKFFPMGQIYRLLFGAGEDFEMYEGKEIWYFRPTELRSCVIWYVVSGIFREQFEKKE